MAKSIALIASEVKPEPLTPLMNLSPIMLAVQFTPVMPIPLLPTAPIVPATCVPCASLSSGLKGLQVLAIALKPWLPAGHVMTSPPTTTENADGADQMLAARSGWL